MQCPFCRILSRLPSLGALSLQIHTPPHQLTFLLISSVPARKRMHSLRRSTCIGNFYYFFFLLPDWPGERDDETARWGGGVRRFAVEIQTSQRH